MTLKQLEAFYWAATSRSFAVAAARLNISVSSLSKRISELELAINGALFNRDSRNAVLTPLGESLLDEAGDLLQRSEAFLARASQRHTSQGRCRIGVGELTALTWLADLIADLQLASPGLSVLPVVNLGSVLQRKLEGGELDCAIVADASTSAAIASHVIGQATFDWVGTPAVAATHQTWRAVDITQTSVITLSEGAGTIRVLDRWLTEQGVRIVDRMTCENLGAVAALIARGLGVGFLPSAWAQTLAERGTVVLLPGAPPLPPLSYAFQWRRDDTRPMLREVKMAAQHALNFSAPRSLA